MSTSAQGSSFSSQPFGEAAFPNQRNETCQASALQSHGITFLAFAAHQASSAEGPGASIQAAELEGVYADPHGGQVHLAVRGQTFSLQHSLLGHLPAVYKI